MDTLIEIVVNGDPARCRPGASVAEVVGALVPDGGPAGRGIAVAVGDDVVPRGRWATTTVEPGARVEVLGAVAGG